MRWSRLGLLLLSFVLLSGCGPQGPQLQVEEAWARSSPMNVEMGAIYFTIRNAGSEPDVLVEVRTEACKRVEIHETYQKEGGAMGMRPVPGGVLPLPPKETVVLKPGGIHLMCIGKQVPFEEGTRFPITLVFEVHDPITVEVEVRK